MDDTHPTIAYDSSGNSNHGTKTNITANTFHYEGSDVPYSWQNTVGYSSPFTIDDTQILTPSETSTMNNVEVSFNFKGNDTHGGSIFSRSTHGTPYALLYNDGDSSLTIFSGVGLPSWTLDGLEQTGVSRDGVHAALFDGAEHEVVLSNINLSSFVDGLHYGGYTTSTWQTLDSALSNLVIDGVSYSSNELIPRDESNTSQDVLGNSLQFSGPSS
jgi:hypothetical protein